jgi:hypothetical protein
MYTHNPKQRIYLFVRIFFDGEKDVSKGTFPNLFSDSVALHALSLDREVVRCDGKIEMDHYTQEESERKCLLWTLECDHCRRMILDSRRERKKNEARVVRIPT